MSRLLAPAILVALVVLTRPRPGPRGRAARWLDSRRPAAPVAALGRVVRARLPVDLDVHDRELGWCLVAALGVAALAPPFALAPPLIVFVVSARRRRAVGHGRRDEVRRGLPEVVDLLALGVGSGLTARDALAASVAWMPPPFPASFTAALGRADAGESFADALETIGTGLGDPVRPLITVLVAAERDGAALVPALERASDEARRQRRLDAEEAARRVPVLMLFPLVLCVLPAFALLSVAPVLIGTLTDLQLPTAGP